MTQENPTTPSGSREPADLNTVIEWIRNNYQARPNLDSLFVAMRAALAGSRAAETASPNSVHQAEASAKAPGAADERAADARDAARYRWLNGPDTNWAPFDSKWLAKHDLYGQSEADMDAFIDAAMAASVNDSTRSASCPKASGESTESPEQKT